MSTTVIFSSLVPRLSPRKTTFYFRLAGENLRVVSFLMQGDFFLLWSGAGEPSLVPPSRSFLLLPCRGEPGNEASCSMQITKQVHVVQRAGPTPRDASLFEQDVT